MIASWQLDQIKDAGYECLLYQRTVGSWRVRVVKGRIDVYKAKARSERKALRKAWRFVTRRQAVAHD